MLKNKRNIFLILIVLATLVMSIAYASISSVSLFIGGDTNAIIRKELLISDITCNEPGSSVINSYDYTVLNSSITLSENNLDSTASIDITIFNNSTSKQYYNKEKYSIGELTYSNENIDFVVSNTLYNNLVLNPQESVSFTITFKYSDEYKNECHTEMPEKLDNKLTSIIDFCFERKVIFNDYEVIPSEYDFSSHSNLAQIESDIPSKTGYIFDGWFDDRDIEKGQMLYDNQQKASDISCLIFNNSIINLYPAFHPIQYMISYNVSLPAKYQELTYIESEGKQAIDLGLGATLDTRTYIKFSLVDYTKANGKYLFGVYDGNKYDDYYVWFSSGYQYGVCSPYDTIGKQMDNNIHTVSLYTKNKISYGELDGEVIYNAESSTVTEPTSNLFIFGAKERKILLYGPALRLYEMKIYKKEKLVRDLVPCVDSENDIAGLFDTVTQTFFKDSNGQDFIRGEEVNTRVHNPIVTVKYDDEYTLDPTLAIVDDPFYLGKWNTSIDGTGTEYDVNEKVSNLSENDGETINIYPIYEKDVEIKFLGFDPITNKKFTAAPILEDKEEYTFEGWESISQEKYFDREGNQLLQFYCDVNLYPIYVSKENTSIKRLDYIESDGNCYVDSGIYGKINTKTEVEFALTDPTQTSYMLGTYSGNSGQSYYLYIDSGKMQYGGISNYDTYRDVALNYDKHTTIMYSDGTYTYGLLDGESVFKKDTVVGGTGPAYTLAICKGGNSNQASGAGTKMKLYGAKFYVDGVLERDFMPCVNLETNEIGLYDKVYDEFHKGLGSTKFKIGYDEK